MIIYRLSDRIPVEIGGITFWVSPLSTDQKARLLNLIQKDGGKEEENPARLAHETIRMSVKRVDGISGRDGSPYQLEFEQDGTLTDDCASELTQVDGIGKLVKLARRWNISDFGLKPVEKIREEYVSNLQGMLDRGEVTQEVFDGAMKLFPFEGVTVDFSKVFSAKKKE